MATEDIRTINGMRYISVGWSKDKNQANKGAWTVRADTKGTRMVLVLPGESSRGDKGWEVFREIKRRIKK